jgi:hypothetical protein
LSVLRRNRQGGPEGGRKRGRGRELRRMREGRKRKEGERFLKTKQK